MTAMADKKTTDNDIRYYDVNGFPAVWEPDKSPHMTTHSGDVRVEDMVKFGHEAVPITKEEYENLKEELATKVDAGDFEEAKHPRDEHGRFGEGGETAGGSTPKTPGAKGKITGVVRLHEERRNEEASATYTVPVDVTVVGLTKAEAEQAQGSLRGKTGSGFKLYAGNQKATPELALALVREALERRLATQRQVQAERESR
jgi:hypothetical protein